MYEINPNVDIDVFRKRYEESKNNDYKTNADSTEPESKNMTKNNFHASNNNLNKQLNDEIALAKEIIVDSNEDDLKKFNSNNNISDNEMEGNSIRKISLKKPGRRNNKGNNSNVNNN